MEKYLQGTTNFRSDLNNDQTEFLDIKKYNHENLKLSGLSLHQTGCCWREKQIPRQKGLLAT